MGNNCRDRSIHGTIAYAGRNTIEDECIQFVSFLQGKVI